MRFATQEEFESFPSSRTPPRLGEKALNAEKRIKGLKSHIDVVSWDAENRLIQMETSPSAISAAPREKINFVYDYQGRRIQKDVSLWNPSTLNYELSTRTKFVWDGWNLVASLNATGGLNQTYLWGNDLSGSQQGAGGVGGLIALSTFNTQPSTSHFVAFDANGNVSALIDTVTGKTSATYEYSPFGETLRATGAMAKANPFRFSTKFTDDETGLLYYGYRYLNPSTGKWLSRDPLQENGGLNLYAAAKGDMVNRFDSDGRKDFTGADGQIKTSQVHSFVDFLDVMLTDFPYAVYKGVMSIPGQVSKDGQKLRAASYSGMRNGDIAFSPVLYLVGGTYEFGGGAVGGLFHVPENFYNAVNYEARYSGLLGPNAKHRAKIEDEILRVQLKFVWVNKECIWDELWMNKSEIFKTTVSAQNLQLKFSKGFDDSLMTGNIVVAGTSIPTLQVMGGLFSGKLRTDMAAGAVTSMTGKELGSLQKFGISGTVTVVNIYGLVRGANEDLLQELEKHSITFSGSPP